MRAVGATIYFADESGLRSDYHTATTWAPRGQTPLIEATGRRFSLNMISAVNAQGEFRFMLHEGSVDATVFREFLKRLMSGTDKAVTLIREAIGGGMEKNQMTAGRCVQLNVRLLG